MVLIHLFILCSLLQFMQNELYYGSPCVIQKDNSMGICVYIQQCPEVIPGIKKFIFPQTCFFEGMEVIVCCPYKNHTILDRTIYFPIIPTQPVRKADKKCSEYEKMVFNHTEDVVHVTVVGGTNANEMEFPHMVQIGFNNNNDIMWICGGSLISDQFVLTAAHCLSSLQYGDAEHARMGIIQVNEITNLQQFRIIQRIPYPNYTALEHYHDIGLVKLSKLVQFTSWVRPACLQWQTSISDGFLTLTGWGHTAYSGDYSDTLQKLDVVLYDSNECNDMYKERYRKLVGGIKDDIMICATARVTGDACQGDSGGPLQLKYIRNSDYKEMYNIVGVTSFGKACALGVPGVYTRVSFYVKWIEDQVWP